jgi:hypothetical protein
MVRWLFVVLLGLQAHFAVSYLVPLDAGAQRTFGGLLRWVWPWSIGDGGPLGRMTPEGFPLAGFFIAVTAGGALILAALAVARIWVPFEWWRVLAAAGAILSLALMGLFFGATKLLPMATALLILAVVFGLWPALADAL